MLTYQLTFAKVLEHVLHECGAPGSNPQVNLHVLNLNFLLEHTICLDPHANNSQISSKNIFNEEMCPDLTTQLKC